MWQITVDLHRKSLCHINDVASECHGTTSLQRTAEILEPRELTAIVHVRQARTQHSLVDAYMRRGRFLVCNPRAFHPFVAKEKLIQYWIDGVSTLR